MIYNVCQSTGFLEISSLSAAFIFLKHTLDILTKPSMDILHCTINIQDMPVSIRSFLMGIHRGGVRGC